MHDTVSEKMSQWLKINQKVSFDKIANGASNIYFQFNQPKTAKAKLNYHSSAEISLQNQLK